VKRPHRSPSIETLEARCLLAAEPIAQWRADDLNGVGAGGQAISTWVDAVGGVAADAIGQPVLINDALATHSVVRFSQLNGTDGFRVLAAGNPIAGRLDFSVAVVFATGTRTLDGGANLWFQNTGLVDGTRFFGATTDWGVVLNSAGQVGAGLGGPPRTVYSTVAGLNDGAAHVAIYTRQAGTLSLVVDGRTVDTLSDGSALPVDAGDITFGTLQSGALPYAGDIAEIRFYGEALPSPDVQEVALELIDRYTNLAPPTVVDDHYATAEDTALTVTADDGVLGNDTDIDHDPFVAELVDNVQHGTVSLSPDGAFLYQPAADFFGEDQFSYLARDAERSSVARVSIDVQPRFDAARAVPDRYLVAAGQLSSVSAVRGVLANDGNPDQTELDAMLLDDVAHGELRLQPDGSFTYDPMGFTGVVSFRYQVVDAEGGQGTARVTLQVDAPPAVQPDRYEVVEDTPLRVAASGGLLANDTDAENGPLRVTLLTAPVHGTLELQPDGSFTYQPAPNFAGTDGFSYQAEDGDLASVPATVTLEVRPVNDRPIAAPDRYSVQPNGVLTVSAAAGVLANDGDVDNSILSAVLIDRPPDGTLQWQSDGSFAYRPAADFSGSLEFSYRAEDAVDHSETVTVHLDVVTGEVAISEFLAVNRGGLRDTGGGTPDWIELVNREDSAIDLAGWYLTDDRNDLTKWSFPVSTVLAPGARLVVFASGRDGVDAEGHLHTNFRLAAQGETLAVVRPDGKTISFAIDPAFPPQRDDISYGLSPIEADTVLVSSSDRVEVRIPTDGQLGTTWTGIGFVPDGQWITGPDVRTGVGFDRKGPIGGTAGFRIRDVESASTVDDLARADTLLLEALPEAGIISSSGIQSETVANRSVVNFAATEGKGHFSGDRPFPNGEANRIRNYRNFAIRASGSITVPADQEGRWTVGIRADDGFRLMIDGRVVIEREVGGETSDQLARVDLPAGTHRFELTYFDRGGSAELEWFAAPGWYAAFNDQFRLVGDVDSGGLAVHSPAVSPPVDFSSLIATDVGSELAGVNTTAYLRIPFTIETDPARFDRLALDVQYDDGFVAYLNGVEVARRNAPGDPGTPLAFDAAATDPRDDALALEFETIDISTARGQLQRGENVLAFQGLNAGRDMASMADFLLRPRLTASERTGDQPRFFPDPTPGAPNGRGVVGFVGEVAFSKEAGYYRDPVAVTLSVNTPGATIRYTTDGSPPTATRGRVYTEPLLVAATTVLRAAAFKDDFFTARVATRTYLFVDDVRRQSPDGDRPPGWPRQWGANVVDYGLDPDIVDSPVWGPQLDAAFAQIPSLSLVTSADNLFDRASGIYANPNGRGRQWERPASLELIQPDGTDGFQVETGVRIRGGFSRSTGNPKHSFRFFFRKEYGDAKLRFPLFGDEGTDTFDSIDLRTAQNYSWSFSGDRRNTFVRDAFSRFAQGEMGQPYTRGRYYHLYINGQYWGLYQTDERPEASYAASYFGGRPDDYDAVKVIREGNLDVEATDGNLDAFYRLYDAAIAGFANNDDYFRIQGFNPDGQTRNPEYERLLDVDNLIDYMILTYYTGDRDGPGSRFTAPRPNNMFGIFNRRHPDGFKWFEHDSEHSLDTGATDMVNPLVTEHPAFNKENRQFFNPHWLHEVLMENAEYRQRFADRVQKHFGPGGVLSEEASLDRVNGLASQIDMAIVAESARWGDAKSRTPLTKNQWVGAVEDARRWIKGRNAVVIEQFRGRGWYPAVDRPSLSPPGDVVSTSQPIVLGAGDGTIYYTLDGRDPRLPGGAIRPGALAFNRVVTPIDGRSPARYWVPTGEGSDDRWQDPDFVDAPWTPGTAAIGFDTGVSDTPLLTPAGFTVRDVHAAASVLDLAGADRLLAGNGVASQTTARVSVINFLGAGGGGGHFKSDQAFPNGATTDFAIQATATLLVHQTGTYTLGIRSDDGARLRIDGKDVIVDDTRHTPRDSFGTLTLDAGEHALELVMFQRGSGTQVELFYAAGGQASFNGTFSLLGEDQNVPFAPVVETDLQADLYRRSASVYLRIPFTLPDVGTVERITLSMRYDDGFVAYLNGTEVARRQAPENLTFDATATQARADADAVRAERIDISRFLDVLRPGKNVLAIEGLNVAVDDPDLLLAPQLEVSFTGQPIVLADKATLQARTLLAGQWSPLQQRRFTVTHPLRITEVHYHPAPPTAAESAAGFSSPDDFEFIELINIADQTVGLQGVRLVRQSIDGRQQGVDFDFSAGAIRQLAPGERLLVVEDPDAFQFRYGDRLPVAGQWSGQLDNRGERITLRENGVTSAAFTYSDRWYPLTDGAGRSLEFIDATLTDPAQWERAARWQASGPVGGTPGRPAMAGDFRGNGTVQADDIDLLTAQIRAGTNRPTFDLTGDQRVDRADVDRLVRSILATSYGDANLDGDVDQADLDVTSRSFSGPVVAAKTWADGDFDGDQDVDNLDLLTALGNYTRSVPLRSQIEPDRPARSASASGVPAGTETGPPEPVASQAAARPWRMRARRRLEQIARDAVFARHAAAPRSVRLEEADIDLLARSRRAAKRADRASGPDAPIDTRPDSAANRRLWGG